MLDLATIIGLSGLSIATVAGFSATITRMWASNERAKAEMTIKMLLEWTNKLDKDVDRCVQLTSVLTEDEVDKVWGESPVRLELNDRKLLALEEVFGTEALAIDTGAKSVVLNEHQSSHIEFHWRTYLNRLEFMLAAWEAELIDETIMLKQLGKYLSYKQRNLNKLINKTTKEYFPITSEFLERKLYERGLGKPKVLWISRILSR